MKKFTNILLALAAVTFAVASCQNKEPEYQPGEPDATGVFGVYFPAQEALGSHTYDPTMDPKVDITVSRKNTSGAATVPFNTQVSEEGVFNFGQINFADGQSETTLEVTFPNAVEGTQYSFSVTIDDPQYASKYNTGAISADFSVLRVEMKDFLNPVTKEPAVITLNEGWWGETHYAQMRYYEVDGVRTCTIYSIEEGGIWGDLVDATLEFRWYTKNTNGKGYQLLEVPKQYFGFDYDDWASKPVGDAVSPIFVYDYYHYWIERGESESSIGTWLQFAKNYGEPDGSYPVGYYDGNGGFMFNLRYYIPGLGGFSPDPYEFVAIAEGFTRVDYSIEVETDYSAGGVTPVYVETGVDVASVKYAIYEGELTATQTANKIAAISDGTDPSTTFSDLELDEDDAIKYGAFGVSPGATGTYTIVVVGFDATGKAQEGAKSTFRYVSMEDEPEYEVNVYAYTEDTPARYSSLHNYDSFAYGIVGEDLTDVHMGIFTEDQVKKYGDQVFDAVKTSKNYALTPSQIGQVNVEGGLYDIAKNLKANTLYYVVVWATNGSLEQFTYSTYQTARLPYKWNLLGQGTLTDGFIMPLFGMDDVTVTCDVYQEDGDPGLYMVTGFQLELCALFYEVDEEVLVPYEGENWFNSEIVIDATDPAGVFIEAQDYGIYVNSNYGYVMIETEASGTLADGAFTWPVKEMYVGLTGPGKWYYGNPDGTFQITLPNTNAPAATPAVSGNVKKEHQLAKNATLVERVKEVYERDPKPVQAKVSALDNNRRDNTGEKKLGKFIAD